jgi:hypothetical protein
MKLDDAQQIVKQLGGHWHGSYGMARCPSHQDSSPSLSIAQGRKGPVFKCWAGCDFRDIMASLRALNIDVHRTEIEREPAPATYSVSLVEGIWSRTRAAAGTLGERYLRARHLPLNPRVRFSPNIIFGKDDNRRSGPGIVVPMHHEDRLVGVQRIFLDPEDREHYGRFKPVLCTDRRAAIQLARAGPVLALTEGWEDALAYMQLNGTPAWAIPGVEWLANTAIPASVQNLLLAFDNGEAAEAAFARHASELAVRGRTVQLDQPPTRSKDWNVELITKIREAAVANEGDDPRRERAMGESGSR